MNVEFAVGVVALELEGGHVGVAFGAGEGEAGVAAAGEFS